MGWQLLGYLLSATVIVTLCFLAFAQYSKVETVPGVILPQKGISAVTAERRGIITAVLVSPGQLVRRGQALARLSTNRTLPSGLSAAQQIAASLSDKESNIARQSVAQQQVAVAERARLAVQAAGLRAELTSLDRQIGIQQQLVRAATQDLQNAQRVAERGFVSRSDILEREERLLLRQQALAQLEQAVAGKQSALSDTIGSAARQSAEAAMALAELDGNRVDVAQQRIDASLDSGFVITAPGDGVVTQVSAKPGQETEAGRLLLTIVPPTAALRAELRIPVQSIGFLAPGQRVRLLVDAFPYQQYGTVHARIVGIAETTVGGGDEPPRRDFAESNAERGVTGAYYPAIAIIDQPTRLFAGRRLRLLSGMTFSARIATRKQSLLAWFLEPLVAVQRR